MKKGIIMDMDDVFLTLLTPDGEFLRARKQNKLYILGEEVHFFPSEVRERTGGSFSFLKLFKGKQLVSAAAALILLSASFLPIYKSNQAYAYMSIDVNPSIEMAVNKEMQVVELTAFNNDGKRILTKIDEWKKKDVSKITENILKEIKKQGYLKSNHTVLISTVRTEKTEPDAEKQLSNNLKKIEEAVSNQHLQLTIVNGTESDLEKAHKMGVTTGKYKEIKNPAYFNKSFHEKPEQKPLDEQEKEKTKIKSIHPSKSVPELKKDLNKEDDEKNNTKKEDITKKNPPSKVKSTPPGQIKKTEVKVKHQGKGNKKKEYKKTTSLNTGQIKKQVKSASNGNKKKEADDSHDNINKGVRSNGNGQGHGTKNDDTDQLNKHDDKQNAKHN